MANFAILIELPKSCAACGGCRLDVDRRRCVHDGGLNLYSTRGRADGPYITLDFLYATMRHPDCPIVALPEVLNVGDNPKLLCKTPPGTTVDSRVRLAKLVKHWIPEASTLILSSDFEIATMVSAEDVGKKLDRVIELLENRK